MKKLLAEFFGTYWLVFGGCGSAVFAAGVPNLGIGYVGVSFAFGLALLGMIYAFGHISGAHFNPAVSIGLWVGGRFPAKDILPYIIVQCVGAVAAAGTIYTIASGKTGFVIDSTKAGSFATNGYDAFSPDGYTLQAAFITEFVLTMFFIMVILGATDRAASTKFSGIAIGFCLTLIHLISIPITNTSVNPARSFSQAIFVGEEALSQLWLFWVAPIFGALVGGFIYKNLLTDYFED